MKNIEKVMKEFMEDYEENPEGWSYWTNRSDEFYDIYILRDGEGYFMKIDSIYTQNPLGMGTKIKLDGVQVEDKMSNFGFRKMNKGELENLLHALKDAKEDNEKAQKAVQKKMENKMKNKPVPRSSLTEAQMVMVGPFNRGQPFQGSSKEHEKADKELKKGLRKKFRKNRPMYR